MAISKNTGTVLKKLIFNTLFLCLYNRNAGAAFNA
jgi:hypothetical protein